MPSQKTYLGKVVDIKDPLYQGRARIEVFGIFDGIPSDDLPWAEQISGLAFGGSFGGGSGGFGGGFGGGGFSGGGAGGSW